MGLRNVPRLRGCFVLLERHYVQCQCHGIVDGVGTGSKLGREYRRMRCGCSVLSVGGTESLDGSQQVNAHLAIVEGR